MLHCTKPFEEKKLNDPAVIIQDRMARTKREAERWVSKKAEEIV